MDASVPDIALEPDKTVRKVQDKFRLDLNDEEALRYMQNLIDVSAAAVMAALVEQLHKIAQYWRKWYASLHTHTFPPSLSFYLWVGWGERENIFLFICFLLKGLFTEEDENR